MIRLLDPETGVWKLIDTSDDTVRENYQRERERMNKWIKDVFARSGVDSTTLFTDRSYIKPLMQLFKNRGRGSR